MHKSPSSKQLGIFMDHSSAHLIEMGNGTVATSMVHSEFGHQDKGLDEKLVHNKEQHQQGEYYRALGDKIRGFKEVLLFGPTTAKNELHNLLKKDHLFADIDVQVADTDKLQGHEQEAFVKAHFSH